jgi:hypothetical protein
MNTITILLLAAAIASVTAMLSPTSVFAPTNNAQDDKNNPTFPGTGAEITQIHQTKQLITMITTALDMNLV